MYKLTIQAKLYLPGYLPGSIYIYVHSSPCLNVQKIWVKSGLERNGRNGLKSGSKAKKVQNPQKYVKIGYFWHFFVKTAYMWPNMDELASNVLFGSFLAVFGPIWPFWQPCMGSYDCTLGFYRHQKYIQVSQTLTQAKKEPKNQIF